MIRRSLIAATAAITLLTGCAAEAPANQPAPSADPAVEPEATESGHGARAGAEEIGEPQNGILTISASGEASLIDLVSEEETSIGQIGAPEALASEGRYGFVTTASGIDIVDGGAWSWDHGDHFHFYRTTPSVRGSVEGSGPVSITPPQLSTQGATGMFFADGTAVALDMAALDEGEVSEWFRIDTGEDSGVVAPAGDHAIVAAGSEARVYDASGEPQGDAVACEDPSGAIATRVGTVIGCADGALLATSDSGSVSMEMIEAPEGFERATAFDGRKGRPTVSALSGENGFWLLDTRAKAWTHVDVDATLRTVIAADDNDDNVLAIDDEGVLHVYGPDGSERGATEPIADEASTLVVDIQRAYLTAPESGLVYEIDYRDGARIARELAPAAGLAVGTEVGR
ncbi:lipoprotein [Microbacterium sorbitolivorans]|uniref:ABC transporter n=1 Tax=Microbacterium sorbitolivorans TaxID=1867410 RepID=A0A367XUG6_9MICO|nr:ABC transporter [Microbacterium sorbitolivorans]RCK57039.1 ABC transporter [Microbacterium sorbitolivorans]GGF47163.1 lipoprotein [Microbacterium sorbitolivorans]